MVKSIVTCFQSVADCGISARWLERIYSARVTYKRWNLEPSCHQLLQRLTMICHRYLKLLLRRVWCQHWNQHCTMYWGSVSDW